MAVTTFLDELPKLKRDMLMHALKLGHSRKKACEYSQISYKGFSDFCRLAKHATEDTSPELYQQYQFILAAEADALNHALKTVHYAIQDGDVKAAQWFLERKDRATFGNQPDQNTPVVTNHNNVSFNLKALSLDQLKALEHMVATLDGKPLTPAQAIEATKMLGPATVAGQQVVDGELVQNSTNQRDQDNREAKQELVEQLSDEKA